MNSTRTCQLDFLIKHLKVSREVNLLNHLIPRLTPICSQYWKHAHPDTKHIVSRPVVCFYQRLRQLNNLFRSEPGFLCLEILPVDRPNRLDGQQHFMGFDWDGQ